MEPALRDGDLVVATRSRKPAAGVVVVIRHPTEPGLELVKRVAGGPGDEVYAARPGDPLPDPVRLGAEEWFVAGDSPAFSTDSRTFGPVPTRDVLGVVRFVYWPPGRIGPVRREPSRTARRRRG
jgi:signal peptidase I